MAQPMSEPSAARTSGTPIETAQPGLVVISQRAPSVAPFIANADDHSAGAQSSIRAFSEIVPSRSLEARPIRARLRPTTTASTITNTTITMGTTTHGVRGVQRAVVM